MVLFDKFYVSLLVVGMLLILSLMVEYFSLRIECWQLEIFHPLQISFCLHSMRFILILCFRMKASSLFQLSPLWCQQYFLSLSLMILCSYCFDLSLNPQSIFCYFSFSFQFHLNLFKLCFIWTLKILSYNQISLEILSFYYKI